MNVKTETVGNIAILTPSGEWDAAASPDFRDSWTPLFESGSRHFVVDFRDVEFVDSSALSSLVSMFRRVNPTLNGQVRLSQLNEDVRRIFQETRLDRVFDIYGTRDDALQGLAAM